MWDGHQPTGRSDLRDELLEAPGIEDPHDPAFGNGDDGVPDERPGGAADGFEGEAEVGGESERLMGTAMPPARSPPSSRCCLASMLRNMATRPTASRRISTSFWRCDSRNSCVISGEELELEMAVVEQHAAQRLDRQAVTVTGVTAMVV